MKAFQLAGKAFHYGTAIYEANAWPKLLTLECGKLDKNEVGIIQWFLSYRALRK